MTCRICGRELSGAAASAAEHGDDSLCGLTHCKEDSRKQEQAREQTELLREILELLRTRLK